ncbi:hypothetical protein [Streptomyces sp. NPDC003077]|uniref:hypothetical protein n=1 Tax=Streptomyces sp. NPDC003077 TaxID=3154443 RepID=UPI00339FCBF9
MKAALRIESVGGPRTGVTAEWYGPNPPSWFPDARRWRSEWRSETVGARQPDVVCDRQVHDGAVPAMRWVYASLKSFARVLPEPQRLPVQEWLRQTGLRRIREVAVNGLVQVVRIQGEGGRLYLWVVGPEKAMASGRLAQAPVVPITTQSAAVAAAYLSPTPIAVIQRVHRVTIHTLYRMIGENGLQQRTGRSVPFPIIAREYFRRPDSHEAAVRRVALHVDRTSQWVRGVLDYQGLRKTRPPPMTPLPPGHHRRLRAAPLPRGQRRTRSSGTRCGARPKKRSFRSFHPISKT